MYELVIIFFSPRIVMSAQKPSREVKARIINYSQLKSADQKLSIKNPPNF